MIDYLHTLDLVWSVHPSYGGSHYGIQPLNEIIVPDTSDVTLDNTQIEKHEIPGKHDKKPSSNDTKLAATTLSLASSGLDEISSSSALYLKCMLPGLMIIMLYLAYVIYYRKHGNYTTSTQHVEYTMIPDTNL